MKFRSLMTAICVLATANIVSAAPFAYIANSGTKNVTVIDTATNAIVTNVALPDDNGATLPNPYAYGVTVGASGQYAYVGLQDTNEVVVIDAATNAVVKRISLGGDSPGGLAVNAAETRLYVASNKSNTLIVINITGSGASEVGRVTVDDSAMSNPEGVVLSTNGLKAYVANSATGSIAEISIDETGNIYTRTNLIALGNNAQPIGLAINSAGTKLYAASLNGTASVIDTATRAVTNLPVANGNVSVAVNTVANKIYAPSNSTDNIYVIDGVANTVSSIVPKAIAAPKGSSVTPDGNKLFLTMNASTSGQTVQVFNTSDLSNPGALPAATISLPAGALPNSMGNFIGPEFPYTITATSVANCTITPSGAVGVPVAVPVNSYGRNFSIATASGACELIIDGASNSGNYGSNYTFSNLTGNRTITALNKAGIFYTLSGDWISSIGGWLVSVPAGISKLSKSTQFADTTSVTLSVGDSTNHQIQAGSWTGDCAGSGSTCTLIMGANKTFGATVILKPTGTGPIFNSTKSSYYQTLAEATAAATTNDVIKVASTYILGGSTNGTPGVTVTLSGNWDSGFSAQAGSVSMGALTITSVAVIANNLTL